MLARSGAIPSVPGSLFEPKLDGFRCLVRTHARVRARSRRGWDMTALLPELLRTLPPNIQLDGEPVALNEDGVPDFHRLSAPLLHGRPGIRVTYFVYDVLAIEGLTTTMLPHRERRALLEQLALEGPHVRLVATFEDGRALFDGVCARASKGVVAKRAGDAYRPGERGWVKTKNRATERFAEERDAAKRSSLRRRPTGLLADR
jgi:bifunctional non-homologous end joining protein LigD